MLLQLMKHVNLLTEAILFNDIKRVFQLIHVELSKI